MKLRNKVLSVFNIMPAPGFVEPLALGLGRGNSLLKDE